MSQAGPHKRTERYETIVIGGGPSGLAAAYELQRRGVDVLVLDIGGRPGVSAEVEAYATRYDLNVRLGVSCRSLRYIGGQFEIVAGDLRYEAANVIIASSAEEESGWVK